MVEAVVFDLDGTLIDTIGFYVELANALRARFSLPPLPEGAVKEWLWRGWGDFKLLIPEIKAEIDPLRLYTEIFEESAFTPSLFPGLKETIITLSERGVKLGIVTATDHPKYEKWKLQPLERESLLPLFKAVVSEADFPARKPSPDPILECLRRLEAKPQNAISVGDSPLDIRAGKAAGTITVGVLTGVSDYELLAAENPSAILQSASELLSLPFLKSSP